MEKWDIFISHASEDKEDVVLPLAEGLRAAGLRVWLDQTELRLGDSLRAKIDEGLSASRFGVVVLSRRFFEKGWPKRELDGLLSREEDGTKVILPVWHDVDHQAVAGFSPILASRLAANTHNGIAAVTAAVASVVVADMHEQSKVAARRGVVWGMDSGLSLRSTQYLDLGMSNGAGQVGCHFASVALNTFDQAALTENCLLVADPLWPDLVKLLCLLANTSSVDAVLSRPAVYGPYTGGAYLDHPTSVSLDRQVDIRGQVRMVGWRSFEALIHCRSWQLERRIDNGNIDFYVIPCRVANTNEPHGPIRRSKVVLQRLRTLMPEIHSSLASLARLTTNDPTANLALLEPIWVDDCVPVWGGDAYWFKGVVQ